jgi:hypothetical protein
LRTSTPQNGGQTYTNGFTPQHPITPGGLDVDQSILAGSKVINSPRHEALFTYFARIVREIWKRKLCATRQSNNVCFEKLKKLIYLFINRSTAF